MIGAYPDLFKAATAYAGVPFACFAGTGEWSSQCANGQLIRTGQQWVRSIALSISALLSVLNLTWVSMYRAILSARHIQGTLGNVRSSNSGMVPRE